MKRLRAIFAAIYDHYLGGGKLWPFVLSLAAALVISLVTLVATLWPGLFAFMPTREQAAAAIDSGFTGLRSAPAIFFTRWTSTCRYDWRFTCLDVNDFAEKIGIAATPIEGKAGCYMVTRFIPVGPSPEISTARPSAPPLERARPPGSLADRMVRGLDIGDSDKLVTTPPSSGGILLRDNAGGMVRVERGPPEELCYSPATGPWGIPWHRMMDDDRPLGGHLITIGLVFGVPDALVHTARTLWTERRWSLIMAAFAALILLGVFVWDEFKPGRKAWSFGDVLGAVVMLPVAFILVLGLIGAIYGGITALAGSTVAQVVWAPVVVFAGYYKGAKKVVGGFFDWTRLFRKVAEGP